MLEAAFRDPVGRIGRKGLVGPVGEHHPREAEIGRAAHDRSKIVRVADAVEHEQRLAVARPSPGRRRVEIRPMAAGVRRPRRRHAGWCRRPAPAPPGPPGGRACAALPSAWQNGPASPAMASSKNSRSTRPGSCSNDGAHRGEPADPHQLPLMRRPATARRGRRPCPALPLVRPPRRRGVVLWHRLIVAGLIEASETGTVAAFIAADGRLRDA